MAVLKLKRKQNCLSQNQSPSPNLSLIHFRKSQKIGLLFITEFSSANPQNYFAVEGVDVTTPIHLLIFDEMGLKVYENKNYGKKW